MTSPTNIARALLALYREDDGDAVSVLPPPPIALPLGKQGSAVVRRPELFLEGLVLRLRHPMEPYRGAARTDLAHLLRVRRAWVESLRAATAETQDDPEDDPVDAPADDPNQLTLL